jgi:hypothetical protein
LKGEPLRDHRREVIMYQFFADASAFVLNLVLFLLLVIGSIKLLRAETADLRRKEDQRPPTK